MRHFNRNQAGKYDNKKKGPYSWIFLLIVIGLTIYFVFRAPTVQSSPKAENEAIPTAYAQEVEMAPEAGRRLSQVTGYTSRPEETDSNPCESASGFDICKTIDHLKNVPADGICATNDYAFGTRIFVDGMGVCVVLDRMNARYKPGTGHIDWYFGKDLDAAKQFGRKNLRIIKL